MDNKRIYDNYAFISYKREDEKWAEWLQRKLEGYKLPTILKKTNPSLPRHLRPIFRDKTDLGGGILSDELEKQLQNSEFLIVICSPHASRSEWVNKEIQVFIDEGRLGNIIPFIVEGLPHAGSAVEECFPQALKKQSKPVFPAFSARSLNFIYSILTITASRPTLRLTRQDIWI